MQREAQLAQQERLDQVQRQREQNEREQEKQRKQAEKQRRKDVRSIGRSGCELSDMGRHTKMITVQILAIGYP
jgi:hypothetical protein